MDKFRKAIEQINKPIEDMARQQAEERKLAARTEEKTEKPVKSIEIKAEELPKKAEVIELEPEIKAEAPKAAVIEPEPEIKVEAPKTETIEPEPEMKAEDVAAEKSAVQSKQKKEKKVKPKKEKKERVKKPKKVKPEKKKKTSENAEADINEQKGKKSKKGSITVIALIVLAVLIFVGSAANYRLNNKLIPTFYQVQSNKVVDNVRIVVISDLHLKEFGESNVRLVDKIQSYHPNIIAIVGDMNMENNPDYSIVINLCARLNAVAPVYYALGNHEIDAMLFNDSQIYYDLKAAGINVFNNEMETVEVGLSKLDIIGLTQNPKEFREYGKKFFDKAMETDDNFKLVLNHYPENFDGVLEDYPIDLALCGHAHGGQVRLPFIGGLYSADQGLFPKLCDGYHEIGNSKLIITRGLGSSGIMPRINNAPEIAIVDINWY